MGLLPGWPGKGFETLNDVRGLLAVPPGIDAAAYERAGYATALRTANRTAYEPG